jgi:uncharacterized protein
VLTKTQRDEIGIALGPAEIQITDDLCIGPATPEERDDASQPLLRVQPRMQGQIVYVALRDIVPDEELTFDYAMNSDEPETMICRCGAPSCRGMITGDVGVGPISRAKYNGYFSWFIQRWIDAARHRKEQRAAPADRHTG